MNPHPHDPSSGLILPDDIPIKPAGKVKARLVIIQQVSYQAPGDPPFGQEERWGRFIDSEEQTYGPRRQKVEREWCALDLGWFKANGARHSLVVIKNTTEGDAKTLAGTVVEVGAEGIPFALLLPGESLALAPAGVLDLRCRAGVARVSVTVLPG